MFKIEKITSDPLQEKTLILPDGSLIEMSLYFVPNQFGWFIPKLSHLDFVLENIRVCVSPNMLHQFKNQIPFGLACFSDREPTQQQDFSSGNATLFILDQAEIEQYARFLSGE